MQIVAVSELGGIQASGLMDVRGSLLWLWSSRRGALILAAVAAVSSLVTIRSATKLLLLLVILRLYRIRGRPVNVNVNVTPPPAPIYYYDYSSDDDNDDDSDSHEDIDDSDSEEGLLTTSPCSDQKADQEEKEDEDIGASHLLWGSGSEMAAARCGRSGGVVKSWVDDDDDDDAIAIHVSKGLGLLLKSHDEDDACNCSINPHHQLLLTSLLPISSSTTTRADPPAELALASVPIVSAAAENGGSTLSVRLWDPRSKGHSVRRMVGAVTASSAADGESKLYLHDQLHLRLVCVVDLRNLRSPLCSHFVG